MVDDGFKTFSVEYVTTQNNKDNLDFYKIKNIFIEVRDLTEGHNPVKVITYKDSYCEDEATNNDIKCLSVETCHNRGLYLFTENTEEFKCKPMVCYLNNNTKTELCPGVQEPGDRTDIYFDGSFGNNNQDFIEMNVDIGTVSICKTITEETRRTRKIKMSNFKMIDLNLNITNDYIAENISIANIHSLNNEEEHITSIDGSNIKIGNVYLNESSLITLIIKTDVIIQSIFVSGGNTLDISDSVITVIDFVDMRDYYESLPVKNISIDSSNLIINADSEINVESTNVVVKISETKISGNISGRDRTKPLIKFKDTASVDVSGITVNLIDDDNNDLCQLLILSNDQHSITYDGNNKNIKLNEDEYALFYCKDGSTEPTIEPVSCEADTTTKIIKYNDNETFKRTSTCPCRGDCVLSFNRGGDFTFDATNYNSEGEAETVDLSGIIYKGTGSPFDSMQIYGEKFNYEYIIIQNSYSFTLSKVKTANITSIIMESGNLTVSKCLDLNITNIKTTRDEEDSETSSTTTSSSTSSSSSSITSSTTRTADALLTETEPSELDVFFTGTSANIFGKQMNVNIYKQTDSTIQFLDDMTIIAKKLTFTAADYMIFNKTANFTINTIEVNANDNTGFVIVRDNLYFNGENNVKLVINTLPQDGKHTYSIIRALNVKELVQKIDIDNNGNYRVDYCDKFIVYTNEEKPKCGNDPFDIKEKKTNPWWIFIIIAFLLVIIFVIVCVAIFFLVREKMVRKRNMKVFEKGTEVNDEDSKDTMSGESNESASESKESEDTETGETGETEETEKSDEVTETKESEDRREKSDSESVGASGVPERRMNARRRPNVM